MITLKSYLDANPSVSIPGNTGGHIASIALVDGRYVMTGVTGRHSLCANNTDNARLLAHWDGFIQAATEYHRSARYAA
jgi:hypothetical protein